MNLGILGCGPAALIAAATAEAGGASVAIASLKKPSYIAGAQYLHGGVPGVTSEEPDAEVEYLMSGTREGYAERVYGDPAAPVSWDRYGDGERLPAWNMHRIYNALWKRFEKRIIDVDLRHGVGILPDTVDRWISTVPLTVLCQNPEHSFEMQKVHIVQRECDWPSDPFVHYNGDGDDAPSWYRHSVLFGHEAFEWSDRTPKPPVEGLVTIKKPLRTNCDCHPHIARMGRYGAWDKNALVHHVALGVARLVNRQEVPSWA